MKICFIMYPWKNIDPETDSTLRLIHEAASRGHTVAVTTVHNLTIRESVTSAFCSIITSKNACSKNTTSFYRQVEFKKHRFPLAGFDIIFMRANPPLDTLALNFLDSIHSDVFIINDINGLRVANNKLYTASFQDSANQFIPKTYVSKNREYLEQVLMESEQEKMIMKPLNSYGGRGVIVIEKRASQSVRSLLDFYIGEQDKENYVILQEYVPGAEEGDIRILMLNGEAIGAMRRVPSKDDVRSNVHAGGTVMKHNLSQQEKRLCKHIGPKLVRDGLYFVGLDVIHDKLIEVNVLSPGGITRINSLNRTRLQKTVIDFVESVVNAKELVHHRKNKYKKVIEDAEVV